ncbi:MAG: CHAT domain-containing protein [Chloroflexi bacterium]|nr:CHAT domain-containing protein [Chloroflexota bacterium]
MSWKPPTPEQKVKQRKLTRFIENSFNISELDDLFYELDIDRENISINLSGKKAMVRELVGYAARRQEAYEGGYRSKMYQLLEAIVELRPGTDVVEFAWLEWPYPSSGQTSAPATTTTQMSDATTITQPVTSSPVDAATASTGGDYLNFDIEISAKRADGRYPVEASCIVGETPRPILQTFPPEGADFDNALYYLRELLASQEDAEQFGKWLYPFLFPPDIQSLFDKANGRAKSEGKKGVRIRLKITSDVPEMTRIPWEYCWKKPTFMALSETTPIVRYLPVNAEIKSVQPPKTVKILLATASPKDRTPIDVAAEEQRVRDALAELEAAGRVELQVISNANRSQMFNSFRFFKPHVLHFIGHGALEGDDGVLIFEDADGNADAVSADDMYVLAQNSDVRLVVLNACETAAQSEENTSDAIMGVAPKLVAAGVPAVVAMQFEIPQETAVFFSRTLYQFLADGNPIDAAVSEARLGIYFGQNEKLYWAIPALFMRSPDGKIW